MTDHDSAEGQPYLDDPTPLTVGTSATTPTVHPNPIDDPDEIVPVWLCELGNHAECDGYACPCCASGECPNVNDRDVATELHKALGDLDAFRPTGLQPDARVVLVPLAESSFPTSAELAAGVALDAFVDDLALASDAHPDTVVDARATYRGQFVVPAYLTERAAAAFRTRILGRPYLAHPHDDGTPGYRLTRDRATALADRAPR